MRCESCGTNGNYDFKNQFVTDDWLRANDYRAKLIKVRKALAELVGASTSEEISLMERAIAVTPAPDAEARKVVVDALAALKETL